MSRLIAVVAVLAAVIIFFWYVGAFNEWANTRWLHIPHTKETEINFGQDWAVGEKRECTAFPEKDGTFNILHCDIFWPKGTRDHRMSVRYWGRIARPDKAALAGKDMFFLVGDAAFPVPRAERWAWDCKRREDFIVCEELN